MLSLKGFLEHSFVFCSPHVKWLLHRTEDQEVRVQALPGSLCCVLGQDTLFSSRRA